MLLPRILPSAAPVLISVVSSPRTQSSYISSANCSPKNLTCHHNLSLKIYIYRSHTSWTLLMFVYMLPKRIGLAPDTGFLHHHSLLSVTETTYHSVISRIPGLSLQAPISSALYGKLPRTWNVIQLLHWISLVFSLLSSPSMLFLHS